MKDYKLQVNDRFSEAVEYLVSNKIAPSKKAVADNLGINPSKLSEILNNRMMAGISEIQNLCSLYRISYKFIFDGIPEDYLINHYAQDYAQVNAQLKPNVHSNTVHNSGNIAGNVKAGKYNIDIGQASIGQINDSRGEYVNGSEQMAITLDINTILDRIKSLLNIDTDSDLAVKIGVKPGTLSAWRSRNSFNIEAVIYLAHRYNLDLHYIFTNEPFYNSQEFNNAENEKLKKIIEQQNIDILKRDAQIELLKSLLNK